MIAIDLNDLEFLRNLDHYEWSLKIYLYLDIDHHNAYYTVYQCMSGPWSS